MSKWVNGVHAWQFQELWGYGVRKLRASRHHDVTTSRHHEVMSEWVGVIWKLMERLLILNT
jgi:hypothetical protein